MPDEPIQPGRREPMSFPRVALLLAAIAYGVIGGSFLVAPNLVRLVDITLRGATADNDVRAVYGGVAVGLMIFFGMCAARESWIKPGLVCVVLTLACMASARVVSWIVAGAPDTIAHLLHASELAGVVVGLLALRSLSRHAAGAAG